MPPDDYPPGWTPWLTHDEPPGKPDVPPVDSLRSGAHTDDHGLYTTEPHYPPAWQQPGAKPVARSQIDEATAAAAWHVVPKQEQE